MSLENKDWLSAASDNQSLSKEQLDALLTRPELQSQLERYHLMASVMRDEKQSVLADDFADNVALLLDAEPTYQLTQSNNFLTKVRGITSAANHRWLQPIAQGAVAAGVALLALFGVQQYRQPTTDMLTPLPVLQTQPIAGFATPVSLSHTTVNERFAEQEKQAMLEQQQRLQALLDAHRQQVRAMDKTEQVSKAQSVKDINEK